MVSNDLLKEMLYCDLGSQEYDGSGVPEKKFHIIMKSRGMLCGMKYIRPIIEILQRDFFLNPYTNDDRRPVSIRQFLADGSMVEPNTKVAELYGNGEVLLKAERTILNILSRCSGIAYETRNQIVRLGGIKVELLDTRKGISLIRQMDKYAVTIGGGSRHRSGFYDGVMVKDNDIAVFGGIKQAIDARIRFKESSQKLEIEIVDFDQLDEVLDDGRAEIIMLDNMSPEELCTAVNLIHSVEGGYKIEASGIGKYDLREIAKTGVDYISTSSLVTKGAGNPPDISMKAV